MLNRSVKSHNQSVGGNQITFHHEFNEIREVCQFPECSACTSDDSVFLGRNESSSATVRIFIHFSSQHLSLVVCYTSCMMNNIVWINTAGHSGKLSNGKTMMHRENHSEIAERWLMVKQQKKIKIKNTNKLSMLNLHILLKQTHQ